MRIPSSFLYVTLTLVLTSCATNSSLDSQAELLRQTLLQLNAAENQSIEAGVEAKIAAIDATMSPSWEGWTNGKHTRARDTERNTEARLFTLLPDYQRTFEKIVIDPPFASVRWTVKGTAVTNGFDFVLSGSTFFEFDESGQIIRSWVYFGNAATAEDLGS